MPAVRRDTIPPNTQANAVVGEDVQLMDGLEDQSRVSASFSARSRMLPVTTGSSALAAIAQLDSRFEK